MDIADEIPRRYVHDYNIITIPGFIRKGTETMEEMRVLIKKCGELDTKAKTQILLDFLAIGRIDYFKIFFEEFDFNDLQMENNLFTKFALQNCYSDEECYEITKYFIEQGVDVSDDAYIKLTHCRCFRGRDPQTKLIILLMEHGANIHCDNEYIFRVACYQILSDKSMLEFIKFLAEQNIDIHVCNDYAICLSLYYEKYELCQYLIELGANVNARDGYCLKYAIQYIDNTKKNYIELLLNANATTKHIIERDILYCILNDNLNNLEILSKYGYDVTIVNRLLDEKYKASSKQVDILERHNINIKNLVSVLLEKN